MSGGYFDYRDESAKGEIFGWGDTWIDRFEDAEISELVWDVFNLIHDYDWYRSGDTCEETYLKKKDEFKKKWFGRSRKDSLNRIIDMKVDKIRKELRKEFGCWTEEDLEE